MSKKIITFKLKGPEGFIIGKNPSDLFAACFGDPPNDNFGYLEDGEKVKYTLTVEKKYTEEDLEKMPESDGEIG